MNDRRKPNADGDSGAPVDPGRLAGGYAPGNLSAEEQRRLLEAALQRQDLFDELMAEQDLKDLFDDPAVRSKAVEVLQEQPSTIEKLRQWWMRPWAWGAVGAVATGLLVVGFLGTRPPSLLKQSGPISETELALRQQPSAPPSYRPMRDAGAGESKPLSAAEAPAYAARAKPNSQGAVRVDSAVPPDVAAKSNEIKNIESKPKAAGEAVQEAGLRDGEPGAALVAGRPAPPSAVAQSGESKAGEAKPKASGAVGSAGSALRAAGPGAVPPAVAKSKESKDIETKPNGAGGTSGVAGLQDAQEAGNRPQRESAPSREARAAAPVVTDRPASSPSPTSGAAVSVPAAPAPARAPARSSSAPAVRAEGERKGVEERSEYDSLAPRTAALARRKSEAKGVAGALSTAQAAPSVVLLHQTADGSFVPLVPGQAVDRSAALKLEVTSPISGWVTLQRLDAAGQVQTVLERQRVMGGRVATIPMQGTFVATTGPQTLTLRFLVDDGTAQNQAGAVRQSFRQAAGPRPLAASAPKAQQSQEPQVGMTATAADSAKASQAPGGSSGAGGVIFEIRLVGRPQ